MEGNPNNLMYLWAERLPSLKWFGHEEQLRICPELAVLQISVWVRGETEAEVINRNTNTATLTELQSSVINTEDCACETTIANTVQKSAWYNQNDFVGRKNNNTHTHKHTHLSRGFAQRRVGETHNLEEDSVVRPDSNFQALIQSAILEQT